MKVKDGFLLRQVAGRYIIVAVNDQAADFDGIVTVNEVGAFIWKLMENDVTEEEILSAVLNEYEVSESDAKADIAAFIAKAKTNGFLD